MKKMIVLLCIVLVLGLTSCTKKYDYPGEVGEKNTKEDMIQFLSQFQFDLIDTSANIGFDINYNDLEEQTMTEATVSDYYAINYNNLLETFILELETCDIIDGENVDCTKGDLRREVYVSLHDDVFYMEFFRVYNESNHYYVDQVYLDLNDETFYYEISQYIYRGTVEFKSRHYIGDKTKFLQITDGEFGGEYIEFTRELQPKTVFTKRDTHSYDVLGYYDIEKEMYVEISLDDSNTYRDITAYENGNVLATMKYEGNELISIEWNMQQVLGWTDIKRDATMSGITCDIYQNENLIPVFENTPCSSDYLYIYKDINPIISDDKYLIVGFPYTPIILETEVVMLMQNTIAEISTIAQNRGVNLNYDNPISSGYKMYQFNPDVKSIYENLQ